VVSISTRETEEDVASLNSSRDEESALVLDISIPPTSKTQSGKQYLKQYGEPVANSLAEKANAEVFVTHSPATCQEEDDNHCHHSSK